jgi:hypothetical protein
MKIASLLLFAIGMVILGSASFMPAYKNEALFMEQYMALSAAQSVEYGQMRNEMLTLKFRLQDYGGTLIALAVGVFLISREGWRNLKSPHSRAAMLAVAFTAPIFTAGGCIFDLFLMVDRQEVPHWADSMGISLIGVFVLFVVLLVWSGAHLGFLRTSYRPALLSQALSLKANWWLLGMAAITAALVLFCASVGQYWHAIPGSIWLYFYVSLAASRCSNHDAAPCAPRDALM